MCRTITEFKWTGEAKSNGWNEVLDRASKQPGANVRKTDTTDNLLIFIPMPAKRKSQTPVVPFGMSNKHMKRKKPINSDLMKPIEPLTQKSRELFRCYKNDQNLVAYGCAGTGKTFITLYNALRDVFDMKTPMRRSTSSGRL